MTNFFTKPMSWLLLVLFYASFLLGFFLGGTYTGLVFFTCFVVSFVAVVLYNVVSDLHRK